jgi:hypothetical protein
MILKLAQQDATWDHKIFPQNINYAIAYVIICFREIKGLHREDNTN